MKYSPRSLTRGALIAAIYCLLTILFQPISFGAVQFRISEALTLLPVLTADAVPGLFIGCLISNLLGGGVWYDVALGSVATVLAAVCSRKMRNHPAAAAVMPVLFNGIIVGPLVYLAYVRAPGEAINWALLYSSAATVAIGEAVVCFLLGLPMLHVLRRLPNEIWEER